MIRDDSDTSESSTYVDVDTDGEEYESDSDGEEYESDSELERREMTAEKMTKLCDRLQSNDPSLTTVSFYSFRSFVPYSRQLGAALLHNTVVSKLWLELADIVESDEFSDHHPRFETSSPLLHFLRSSPCLSFVSLGEESGPQSATSARIVDAIFHAVAANSNIQELSGSFGDTDDSYIYPSSYAHMLRATQSLCRLTLSVNGYENDPSAWPIIAGALGENQTLEELELQSHACEKTDGAEHLLMHVGSLPKLRKLCIRSADNLTTAHFNGILAMLGTTTSLQELKLDGYLFNNKQMSSLSAALNANPGVSTLRVDPCYGRPGTRLIDLLPSLTGIRTIYAHSFLHQLDDVVETLAACRANGSLRQIEDDSGYITRRLSKRRRVLLSAYLERNKNLSTLLAHPKLHGSSESKETDLGLFPSLFQVACDARRMAPTFLLAGLLAAEEDVVQEHDSFATSTARQEAVPKIQFWTLQRAAAVMLGIVIALLFPKVVKEWLSSISQSHG